MTPRKTLCIDYGTQRIGLAMAIGPLAEPYAIWPAGEDLIERLHALIQKEQIVQIVVGISEGAMQAASEAFGRQLHRATGVPVFYQDETLSSRTVGAKLKEAKSTKRFGPIDDLAAADILQEWLDENRA